jgi:hypothetical protein
MTDALRIFLFGVLAGVVSALAFVLLILFFVRPAPPSPVDIHKQKERIQRDLDAKKLELLKRSQKKSVDELRKELLEGAGNAK